MKEIPILYSTPMIQAKLEGRKTQTRRIVKQIKNFQLGVTMQWGYTAFTPERYISIRGIHANGEYGESFVKCPYGKPGDLLWARETLIQNGELGLEYFANHETIDESIIPNDYGPYGGEYSFRNIPNIHMPKWAARIWDRVISIRVERLQSISEEDAFAEGIDTEMDETYLAAEHYQLGGSPVLGGCPAVCAYAALWERINGPGSWEANPWVWRIETENLTTTGRPDFNQPTQGV